MSFDRKYLVWALSYAVVGMSLGVFMAASHDYGQHVTHAHILLVGFVVSLVYAVIHRLWLEDASPGLARVQFIVHQAGAVTMFVGLLSLYGNLAPAPRLEPMLAAASTTVLVGAVLMLFMIAKPRPAAKGRSVRSAARTR